MPCSTVRSFVVACCSAATLVGVSPALGQGSEDGFNKDGDDAIAAQKQADEEKAVGDKMPGEKDKAPEGATTGEDPIWDTAEDPTRSYKFINLRFRDVIVPKFILNLFADGGRTVNVFTFGPEFSIRKDRLEYDIAFSYADYSMDPFMFKGKSDGDDAWEVVSSDLKVLYLTFDVLYGFPIDTKGRFTFLVGGGVGLGGVLGKLYRNQVSPKDRNNLQPDDPTQWNKCIQPGVPGDIDPGTMNAYCDSSNAHYDNYDEPSWANGGSKPFIFPWLSLPQLSFRYKPIKYMHVRADVGFSITGFFFGLSAGGWGF
jgi:hypothetical protein